MYAIMNTKTGKLLSSRPEVQERCYRYERPYNVAVTVLTATNFGGDSIFVTNSKKVALELIEKSDKKVPFYRDIYIDTSYPKIELSDLKVVTLQVESENGTS